MTVLVIDDDPRVARSVRRLLQDHPEVEVLVAEDGASGLRQAAIHAPDLALVDWMLPDMDGLDVVREMKRWPRSLQPRTVVTMTGSSAKPLQEPARALGMGRVLQKPLRSEDLQRVMGSALKGKAPAIAARDLHEAGED